jgi:dipeptidase
MCDTLVALPNSTADGNLLFAKNSDREPDEAQGIIRIPNLEHSEDTLQCTYIEIPQVSKTYECILSKPFQMWGSEMGVNEHGVVIGNEAVFTKVKFQKNNQGLTGMDLLRLALERSNSAQAAIHCITSLLAAYGQNACGGYKNKSFYYHNSFLIADKQEAWVLETAGNEWAVEKVRDIRSISNSLSITDNANQLSPSARDFAKHKKWWNGIEPFNFQKVYSDWLYTTIGRASMRQACTTDLSLKKKGQLSVTDCMRILQTHNQDEEKFRPTKANTGSICMHATGLLNPSSTTSSMVTVIRSSGPHTVWLTGTSSPCLSVYLPFFFGSDVLTQLKQPSSFPDDSLWWKAEKLHRWISKDYRKRKQIIEAKRLAMQQEFIAEEQELIRENASIEKIESFSKRCLQLYSKQLDQWLTHIE